MRILLAAILLAAQAVPAFAAFEDLGAGGRAPGMGDAFTALADDVYAIHYNPAGLYQLDRPELSVAYSKLYTGLSDGSDLGTSQLLYAHPISQGNKGTWGVGWERFALTGLYSEQTLEGSYGRKVWTSSEGGQLATGVNLKYLTHSFSVPGEASSACNNGQCGLGTDPVLSGATSKSTPDADLGFIYRFPRRLQMGLMIQHLLSPDVGFGSSDKLQRSYDLGLAYKSLWLNLVGEMKMVPNALGGTDRDMIIGAERFFPTLDYGSFGLRGSVGYGLSSSDWRQLTMGASYRINKIQTDYAFILPVGGVQGQSGSHRISLTFHFGAPTGDEEISQSLLEQAKRLREKGPDYGSEYSQELKPKSLEDPNLADVKLLIEQRLYRKAQQKLVEIAQKTTLTKEMVRLANRLDLAAYHYAELPEPKLNFDKQLVGGIRRFLYGEDRLAMLQVSYALSMKPDDDRVSHLLDGMEKAIGIKATRLPPDHPRGFLDEMLYQIEFAHTRGDDGRAESIASDILALEPQNMTALERLGSLRYLAGRMIDAVQIWQEALKNESNVQEIESLNAYIRMAQDRASGKILPGQTLLAPAPAPTPAPAAPAVNGATQAPAATDQTAPAQAAPDQTPTPAAQPSGDPRDVEKLYQKGVEHYARGEYLQASAMFLRILQIDPDNEQAKKALERIDRRNR